MSWRTTNTDKIPETECWLLQTNKSAMKIQHFNDWFVLFIFIVGSTIKDRFSEQTVQFLEVHCQGMAADCTTTELQSEATLFNLTLWQLLVPSSTAFRPLSTVCFVPLITGHRIRNQLQPKRNVCTVIISLHRTLSVRLLVFATPKDRIR